MPVNIFKSTLVPTIGDSRRRNVAPGVSDPLPDPQSGDIWIDMSGSSPVLKVLDGSLSGANVGLVIGGTSGQIEFNNSGALGGIPFTSADPTTGTITIATAGGSSRDSLILNSGSNGGIPLTLNRTVGASDLFRAKTGSTIVAIIGASGQIISQPASDVVPFVGNNLAGSPTADLLQLQVGSVVKFRVDVNGNISVAGGTRTSNPAIRRFSAITYDGSSATAKVMGVDVIGTPGTGTQSAGTTTQGPFLGHQSGAGTSAGVLGRQQTRAGRNATASFMISVQEHALAGRYWFGLWDQANSGAAITTDTPTGNFAMLRFSVAAGDTTWKFITRDGTTANVVDTGVAPVDVQENTWTFQDNGTSWTVARNGTVVATSSANLPANTVLLGATVSSHNPTGAGVLQINTHQIYIESDL